MIRIVSWNAHSLDELKREQLFQLMAASNVQVCGILESWKFGNGKTYDETMGDMRLFGLNHPNGRRGVCVITRRDFKIEYLPDYCLELQDCEMIAGLIGDIVFVFAYLPVGSSTVGINNLLGKIELLEDVYENVIVMGDFNTRLGILESDGWNEAGIRLYEFLNSGDYRRVPINGKTFLPSSRCLDHVVTTKRDRIKDWGVLRDSFDSDHLPIWIDVELDAGLPRRRLIKRTNWIKAAKIVEQKINPWKAELKFEDQVNEFVEICEAATSQCTKTVEFVPNCRPYFDADLKRMIREKNRCTGSLKREKRREIRRILRQRKRKAWRDFCTRGLKDRSGKMLWSNFKKSRGERREPGVDTNNLEETRKCADHFAAFHVIREDLVPKTSELQTNSLKHSEHECDDWCSVSDEEKRPIWGSEPFFTITQLSTSSARPPQCPLYMQEPVTIKNIKDTLKCLPNKGSVGLDGISYLLLKESGDRTILWLTECVNTSLRGAKMSKWWKMASITPLKKSSGGYRPISLLSNLAKLTERVVAYRLRYWARLNGIIPKNQFADHGGTQVALQRFVNFVRRGGNNPTYCVFFDVRKAFDRVHLPTLTKILCDYECPMYLTRWIVCYLSDRKCYVGSSEFDLINGVPQGSVLGPILFQIYVSHVMKDVQPDVFNQAYADDFLVGFSDPSIEVTKTRLNEALQTIDRRCKAIGVELDQNKTVAMWLCKSRGRREHKKIDLRLGETILKYCDSYKYLGVVFDKRLTMREHVDKRLKVCRYRNNKVFRMSGLVKRGLRSLWRGYVESYLMYGLACIWPFLCASRRERVVALYVSSARRIAGVLKSCPADFAITESGLWPFEDLLSVRSIELTDDDELVVRPDERPELTAKALDMVQSPGARHVEMTFSRWRSKYLYTNDWKQRNRFPNADGLCRYCLDARETREHLLRGCERLVSAQRVYWKGVYDVLGTLPTDLDVVLDVYDLCTRAERVKLATSITMFCDSIDFWS